MSNGIEIIKISKTILNLYGNLFKLEVEGKIDDNFYNIVELLNCLLIKEDILYKKLNKKDFKFLDKYIKESFKEIEGKEINFKLNKDNFYNLAVITEEHINRIINRANIYSNMRDLKNDMDWYNGIVNGVYLNKMDDEAGFSSYLTIFSLYSIISDFNLIENSKQKSEIISLTTKYLTAYNNPFLEKYLVQNRYKTPENYDKFINIANIINEIPKYIVKMNELFEEEFQDAITEILTDNFSDGDDMLTEILLSIKSFLAILNDEDKKAVYVNLNNFVTENEIQLNENIKKFFEIFDEFNLNNKEKQKKKLKGNN